MVETRSARKAKRGASPVGRDAERANPAKPAAAKKAASNGSKKGGKADELPAEISPYDMTFGQLVVHCYFLPMCLLLPCPVLCAVLAFATNSDAVSAPTLGGLYAYAVDHGVGGLLGASFAFIGVGTTEAWTFLAVFNTLALLIYWWPGETKCGPLTATGHLPEYVDNGVAHCALFSGLYAGGAYLGWYDFGVLFDVFGPTVGALNAFGLVFCVFLYFKGLHSPCTKDSGTSGGGFVFDYYWGMELYPRICGVDVKKFVNCRFSMTFWQLAGACYTYRSYTTHGKLDPGLFLAAVSQYVYLVKFFVWEIGYMRSIDIIVDRAGFYETWGCIVWVPTVYTLHSRICVTSPSQLSWPVALAIFGVGIAGVGLNYWADNQRMTFREKKGDCLVWGRKPVYIEAKYVTVDKATGVLQEHDSLLLASGWWGQARHLQYSFELTAAWSWGLLANPAVNGPLPLFYAVFLTILLIHRAIRDEEKCLKKYGAYYEDYMARVKYRIVPGVY